MHWEESSSMDQRMQFITDHHRGSSARSELCARNRISRKTGYKWLARDEAEGPRGLIERSHAPHVCPHRIPEPVAALLVAGRIAHPNSGPGNARSISRPGIHGRLSSLAWTLPTQ